MKDTGEKRLLEHDIEKLDAEIRALGNKRAELQLRVHELTFGVKVGDTVEYKGLKGQISGFYYSWPQIKLYKKDGTLGLNTKHCFDWEKDLKKL